MERPLSHLSPVLRQHPLIHLPGRADTLVSAVHVGGPEDPADRRLYIGRRFMAACWRAAEAATTSRAVIEDFGLHARAVRDGGHTFEIVTIQGKHILPEDSAIVRMALQVDAPGVSAIEEIYKEERVPLGRGVVEREVLYTAADTRLYLEALDILRLQRACEGLTGWICMHHLGLVLKTWKRGDGTLYNVCTLLGTRLEAVAG